MKITNILFWVQENKISEKFYKRLGFEVVESDEEHSTLSLNGFKIDLVSMRDEEKFSKDSMSVDKGRGVYIYIQTEDVDIKYTELIRLGLTPSTKPRDWSWGKREFIIKDPDGYKLCFWQSIKK